LYASMPKRKEKKEGARGKKGKLRPSPLPKKESLIFFPLKRGSECFFISFLALRFGYESWPSEKRGHDGLFFPPEEERGRTVPQRQRKWTGKKEGGSRVVPHGRVSGGGRRGSLIF